MSAPVPYVAVAAFRPGQLGIRHLLGLMTVAAIVLGITAARLRAMKPLETALLGWHWAVLLAIVGLTFVYTSRRRRQDQAAAGELLLQTYSRPQSERRRALVKWALTVLVILDGIWISLARYPHFSLPPPGVTWTRARLLILICGNLLPQHAITEGVLWGWCLNHWLSDVYLVELRENGIITCSGYFPWEKMGRLGWSTVHPGRLVFYYRRQVMEIPVDPSLQDAVNEVLKKIRGIEFDSPMHKTRKSGDSFPPANETTAP